MDLGFSLAHTKKLLLVTVFDTTAETEVTLQTHRNGTGGQTEMKVEVVI